MNRPSIMDALITVSRQLQICVGPKSVLNKVIVTEPVVPVAVEMQTAVEQLKKADAVELKSEKKAANKVQTKKAKQKKKEDSRDLTQ